MPKRENQRYNKWTQYQDEVLLKLISQNGSQKWQLISKLMKQKEGVENRTGKQCRERWINQLNQDNKKFVWTDDKNLLLFELYGQLGSKWCEIVKHFPNNCDSFIKNRFYSLVRKSLRRMCKFSSVKTNSMKIYDIKPSTAASIIYSAELKDPSKSTLLKICKKDYQQPQSYYNKISQHIKSFVFRNKQSKKDNQTTSQDVLWALEQIIQIDMQIWRHRESGNAQDSAQSTNERSSEISYLEVPGFYLEGVEYSELKRGNTCNAQSDMLAEFDQNCFNKSLSLLEQFDLDNPTVIILRF